MTAPRILFISQNHSTHARRFLAAFAETGHEVYFLPCEAAAPGDDFIDVPSPVSYLSALGQPESSSCLADYREAHKLLRRTLEALKPDLILAGPIHTGGALAALTDFSPLIVMSWGYDVLSVPRQSEWLNSVVRFALSRADLVLGDCKAVQHTASELCPASRDRIVWFPWGVDLKKFRPGALGQGIKDEFGWEDCRVIVTARSMELIHGTMTFLEAMKRVLRCRADARVMMLGDGSLGPCAEEFIEENGLRERIRVIGRVPEEVLPKYFVNSDLYVSAATCDGSSISLLEAMGCGLTAVVPNVGGNNEWIVPRQNGWLYPAGDVDGLVAATKEALEDDETRSKMGLVNVRIVREGADWNRNFRRLLDICDRLIATGSPREVPLYAQP